MFLGFFRELRAPGFFHKQEAAMPAKQPRSVITLFLMLVTGFLAGTATAQSDSDALTAQVDSLFAAWDRPASPGAAVAIIKDGAVVYTQGYGSAQLEYEIPITPSTVFHVASVSKQFTAFAVALLAHQGKLSLDDDIRTHLPEVPDFGRRITIRHLIHHTSGLRDQWELLAMAGWRIDDVITTDHILAMVRHQQDLNFDPGEQYLYSNTGYTLLAEIVEEVSGQSFREWTAANIFEPLGMTHTHFHDDHQMIVKNRAYSYGTGGPTGFRKSVLSYANVGATSLFTTVEDLARWLLNFEEKNLGGAEVIEQMHQRGRLNNGDTLTYAFALGIGEHRGMKTVGHSGGDAGFRSYVVRFPEARFGVVVLSNLGTMAPWQKALAIADLYLADRLAPPGAGDEEEIAEHPVDPAILSTYEGTYQLRPGWLLTISLHGDSLMTQATMEGRFTMTPESDTTFFVKSYGARITFRPAENGEVNQLEYRGIVADRVELVRPSPEALRAFVGDYYSEELGTTYTIALKNNRLVARHRRNDDVALTPTAADQFASFRWWFRAVVFTRDDHGEVTGFRLTGGRVRNLRFDRVS